MNRWNIPEWLENEVRARDKKCVYCGKEMVDKVPLGSSRNNLATWEHIINDETIITQENIALCCSPCNSSKGTNELSVWINSKYCQSHNISYDTVAEIIKQALTKSFNS
jgi:hypothetical protein